MIFRQIALLILSCTLVLMTGAARAETLHVILVLSDASPTYRLFADSFHKSLAAGNGDVKVVEALSSGSVASADLIVAVGMKAAEFAADQIGTPVLAVLVPEAGYKELLATASRKKPARPISAIYLNQPWERQIDFLQAAFPGRHRIGLLYSPDNPLDVVALKNQIASRGGLLVAQPVPSPEKLFASLESVLERSDLLLAIADSAIYNGGSIRNILLTSYRKGTPLIGISQSYINAGALCAIFSTTEQVAGQAGAAVAAFSRNRRLPEPQYPAEFTIEMNQQVAISMGLSVPSAEAVRNRMSKAARGER